LPFFFAIDIGESPLCDDDGVVFVDVAALCAARAASCAADVGASPMPLRSMSALVRPLAPSEPWVSAESPESSDEEDEEDECGWFLDMLVSPFRNLPEQPNRRTPRGAAGRISIYCGFPWTSASGGC
jgi:hypothetical protein